jgi:sulfatase maturation enzyme AslB (radical SAM superfamily)
MVNITKLYCGADQPADNLRYGHGHGAPKSAAERKPIVVWNVTRTCNLRCVHCYSDSYAQKYSGELTTDEAKGILDDLASFGVPAVLFSGGEPLTRPDLLELMAYAINSSRSGRTRGSPPENNSAGTRNATRSSITPFASSVVSSPGYFCA